MRVEHMSEKDSDVTELPKFAERIPDRANGKHCQRQSRAKASEHICGLIMESMLKIQREYSIEPTANPVRNIVGR